MTDSLNWLLNYNDVCKTALGKPSLLNKFVTLGMFATFKTLKKVEFLYEFVDQNIFSCLKKNQKDFNLAVERSFIDISPEILPWIDLILLQ